MASYKSCPTAKLNYANIGTSKKAIERLKNMKRLCIKSKGNRQCRRCPYRDPEAKGNLRDGNALEAGTGTAPAHPRAFSDPAPGQQEGGLRIRNLTCGCLRTIAALAWS